MTERATKLRLATLDDAAMVADLETARLRDEPRDGVMVRFWWKHRQAPNLPAGWSLTMRSNQSIRRVGA